MLGRLIRWVSGRAEPAAEAPSPPDEAAAPVQAEEAASADGGRSPVFSSRAVRDAAVVTSSIEALRRYVAGDEGLEQTVFKLQSLSSEQFSFLQLSLEPGLVDQAMARTADHRSPQAAALRRILTELAGNGSGVPALPPAIAALSGPRPPRPTLPIPPRPAPPPPPGAQGAAQGAAPGAAAQAAPAPAPEPPAAPIQVAPIQVAPPEIPAAPLSSAPAEEPAAVPPPPPRPADRALPRLTRDAAEARRARLFDSISDNVP